MVRKVIMELEEFLGLYLDNFKESGSRLAETNLRILYKGLKETGLAERLTKEQAMIILGSCGSFRFDGLTLGYLQAMDAAVKIVGCGH